RIAQRLDMHNLGGDAGRLGALGDGKTPRPASGQFGADVDLWCQPRGVDRTEGLLLTKSTNGARPNATISTWSARQRSRARVRFAPATTPSAVWEVCRAIAR